MKTLINCITFIGITLFSVSCTDLTESVYSEVTEENFEPTGDDIVSLIAPVYTALRPSLTNRNLFWSQEESADAIITPVRPGGSWYDGGEYIRMHQHTWDPFQEEVEAAWTAQFNGVNAANRVIYQIESGQVPIPDEQEKQAILAELKTARAFYYSVLLDLFGNVPIVTDFSSEELPQQQSRQEVYDFVVSEITENMALLSDAADLSTYGRFNSWAARAILAKVYLNAEVYTGTPQWEKVIEVCDQIIGSQHFALEPSYRTPFSRENHTSTELVFAIPYDAINASGNQLHLKTLKNELTELYGMNTGVWGGSSSQPQFIDTYDEDDQRFEDTWIHGPQYNSEGEEVINFVKDIPNIELTEYYHGYPFDKYELYEGMTGQSDVDFPFVRYAEILMMKAEALLRTGRADEAASLVTQVRERAFAGTDPGKATVTGAQLQEGSVYNYGLWENGQVVNPEGGADIEYGRMLDELGWEFAAEGHRRTDMIRFGVFTTKSWFNHSPSDETKEIFPIPNGVLQNNTNLTQNPGY